MEVLALKYHFRRGTPWRTLSEDQRQKVLFGSSEPLTIRYTPQHGRTRSYTINFEGVIPNLNRRYKQAESQSVREEIESYMSARIYPVCHGARLRADPPTGSSDPVPRCTPSSRPPVDSQPDYL